MKKRPGRSNGPSARRVTLQGLALKLAAEPPVVALGEPWQWHGRNLVLVKPAYQLVNPHPEATRHVPKVEPHLSRAPAHVDAQDAELGLLDEKSFGITGTRVPTAPPGTTAFSDSFACNCLHLWGHFQLLPRGRLDHGADWRLAYLSPPNVRNSPPSRR